MASEHDEASPAPRDATSTRFCRVCGDDLRSGAAFCSRCGAPTGVASPAHPGPTAIGQPGSGSGVPPWSPTKRAGVAVALSLLVLLAALAGAGAALYHRHQQDVAAAHAAASATMVALVDARQTATTVALVHAQQTATVIAASTATAGAIRQATAQAIAARTATAGAILQATADTAATALAQATAHAQATADAQAARAAAQPVRVCPAAAVPSGAVLCSQPYTSISGADWPEARLSYSSVGATFTSTGTHFAIASTSDNGQTFITLGTYDINQTSLAAGSEADSLSYLFANAGVTPEDGTTYQVEVDNGGTLLGTVQFTYAVGGVSTAGSSATD
jgi:hypothetical protein